jgi:hypothetical protein
MNEENNFNKMEVTKSECDGLFTNRLLWLGASAGAVFPSGLRLPQPRPAGRL